jgi:hypothetical protein
MSERPEPPAEVGWRSYAVMWTIAVLQAERRRRRRALTTAAVAHRLRWRAPTVQALLERAEQYGLTRRTPGGRWVAGWDPLSGGCRKTLLLRVRRHRWSTAELAAAGYVLDGHQLRRRGPRDG